MDFLFAAGGAALLSYYLYTLGGSRSYKTQRERRAALKRAAPPAKIPAARQRHAARAGDSATA